MARIAKQCPSEWGIITTQTTEETFKMILLRKEIYKNVDKTKYFRSVDGNNVEVTASVFNNLSQMSFTLRNSSESYFDRTVITREVEFV